MKKLFTLTVIALLLSCSSRINGQNEPTTPAPSAPRPNPQMGRRIISPEVQSDNRASSRLPAEWQQTIQIIITNIKT